MRGFPVLEARVSYAGEGYAAVMGWLQLVRYTASDEPEPVVEVDVAPQLREAGSPYVVFGVRPTLFDAPAISAPEADWHASTFLAASPDCVMTRTVRPLCGFRWGYTVGGGRARVGELVTAGRSDWADTVPEFRSRYPDWDWGDAFPGG